jgi:glutaredoxin
MRGTRFVMTLFERVFYGLERLDANVTRVRNAVVARSKRRAETAAVVDEAMARHIERGPKPMASAPPQKPLGDPSVPMQIYGRKSEPWTGRALLIVRDQDLPHAFVDLEQDDGRLEARLQSETKQTVMPYVFIRGEFIGGYNALDELNRLGALEDAIKPPSERKNAFVVPKRGPENAPPGERS